MLLLLLLPPPKNRVPLTIKKEGNEPRTCETTSIGWNVVTRSAFGGGGVLQTHAGCQYKVQ